MAGFDIAGREILGLTEVHLHGRTCIAVSPLVEDASRGALGVVHYRGEAILRRGDLGGEDDLGELAREYYGQEDHD